MAQVINPPRGMRDFLPAEKAVRERMLASIRAAYATHGFDEVEAPAMEELDRLAASDGGDNQKMTFNVLRRRLKPEDIQTAAGPETLVDLGLRYDLTVPLARFYATNRAALPTVFRAVQIGPVWRAERPQRGRYRQFMQCDIDIIGEPGVLAEAELFQATADALDSLGVEGWTIHLNSRVLLNALLAHLAVPAEHQRTVLVELDKLDKVGAEAITTSLRTLDLDPATLDGLDTLLNLSTNESTGMDQLSDLLTTFGLEAGEDIRDLLTALPAPVASRVVFDPLLIRGMGYYTGLIYEIRVPGSTSSVGGGGRYNGLIGKLAGVPTPAVGMSLGFERLVDLVNLPAVAGSATVLVYDRDVEMRQLLGFKADLVAQGVRVRLERKPRKLPELLSRLTALGFDSFATVRRDTQVLVTKPLGEADPTQR